MEEVFRKELTQACPAADDIELFERAVVEACACHLFWILPSKILKKDVEWGISTLRQRALVRLSDFAEISANLGHLEQLEPEEMPLYPAFR